MDNSGFPALPPNLRESYPELENARAVWDKRTGQLENVRGLLTEPSGDSPERIAERLVDRYSPLLGKGEGSVLDDLALAHVTEGPAGYTVRYRQHVGEIPVYGAQVSVHVTKNGQVYRVSSSYRPGAARVNVSEALEGGIPATNARQIAVGEVKGENRLRRTPEAELAIYPLGEADYPAWQVSVALETPAQAWIVFVDGRTGRVLDKVPTLVRRAE